MLQQERPLPILLVGVVVKLKLVMLLPQRQLIRRARRNGSGVKLMLQQLRSLLLRMLCRCSSVALQVIIW